jgi:hypothetical protein
MVLELVLVVAGLVTTMGTRSWLTGGQEEGLVLVDGWLLMSDRLSSCCSWMLVVAVPTTTVGNDRSRLIGGQEEGLVLDDDWLLMSDR